MTGDQVLAGLAIMLAVVVAGVLLAMVFIGWALSRNTRSKDSGTAIPEDFADYGHGMYRCALCDRVVRTLYDKGDEQVAVDLAGHRTFNCVDALRLTNLGDM